MHHAFSSTVHLSRSIPLFLFLTDTPAPENITLFPTRRSSDLCPVCLGMPGVLPVANEEALKLTALTGILLNCEIPRFAKLDRKSTRLNSSHSQISYAVLCLKKKSANTMPTSCVPASAFHGDVY